MRIFSQTITTNFYYKKKRNIVDEIKLESDMKTLCICCIDQMKEMYENNKKLFQAE